MPMDNTPLLVVPDILVAENTFLSAGRKQILTGATLNAEKGHITGLLGRNGAGKTSLLQCIFGARAAQECDVFLNGVKIFRPFTANGLVNYLPQKPFLPPTLTLKKITQHYHTDADHIATLFPVIATHLNNRVNELSGGLERLFSLLLLLFAPTRFTLLDEPFTHLAPAHIEVLKQVLATQKQNKGIIITDHMYRHVLDLSDKLYLMKEGRSILIRDWDDLVLHGYVRGLSLES